jgi:hypothetical protein
MTGAEERQLTLHAKGKGDMSKEGGREGGAGGWVGGGGAGG